MKSAVIGIISSVIGCTIFVTTFLVEHLVEIQCIDEEANLLKHDHYDSFKFSNWISKFLIVTFFYFKHQLL